MTIQEMQALMQRYQELEEQQNDDFLPEQQKIREQFAAIGLHISVDGYGSVAVW